MLELDGQFMKGSWESEREDGGRVRRRKWRGKGVEVVEVGRGGEKREKM